MHKYCYCSLEEAEYRQRTEDVHMLEATDGTRLLRIDQRVFDPCRIVKKFVRSGSLDLHKSFTPRTLTQLESTVTYLLMEIWNVHKDDETMLPVVYTFVQDRIQAVRQDIITENHFSVAPVAVVCLFERLVHYYLHSMHTIVTTYSHRIVAQTAPMSSSKPTTAPQLPDTSKYRSTATPLSAWFDLHLHENALSSCLATCLTFCAPDSMSQMPSSRKLEQVSWTQDIAIIRDRITAYALLLTTASALRETCQGIYNGTFSSSSGGIHGGPILAAGGTLLRATGLADTTPTSTTSSAAVVLMNATSDMSVGRGSTERQNIKQTEEKGQGQGLVHSTAMACALRCLSCVRQKNPAGAVAAFHVAFLAGVTVDSGSGGNIDVKDAEGSCNSEKLALAALLWHMLPELRLWRLLLMDTAANKDEAVDSVAFADRLWLCPINNHDGACRLICTAVGLSCRVIPCVSEVGLTKASDGDDGGGSREKIEVVLKASSREGAVSLSIPPSITANVAVTTNGGKGERREGRSGKGGEGGAADALFDRRVALIAIDAPISSTKARTRRIDNERSQTVFAISSTDIAWDEEEDGVGDAKMVGVPSPVTAGQGLGLAPGPGPGASDVIDKKAPTACHTRARSEVSARQAVQYAKRLIESATAEDWFGTTVGGGSSSNNNGSAW